MKFYKSFLLVLLSCSKLIASNDSTIFNNKFEQNIFNQFSDSIKVDPIELLSCYEYSENQLSQIKNRLNTTTQKLEASGIRFKPLKKQIKEIYSVVHSTYLTKYEEKAFFNDIFNTGYYNCVTASALFAYYYSVFNIPFQIKETPVHVYIIADPVGNKTLVESTKPSKGVVVFDEKFKKSYVQYLADNKIISQDDFLKKPTDVIFEEFYSKDKNITLSELAGLQYYNRGIFQINDTKYSQATVNFEKAYQLYPSVTIQYMLNSSYISELYEQNTQKKYSGKVLARYLNININNAEAIEYTDNYFKIVADELIINHPKPLDFKRYYNEFKEQVSDSVEMSSINQTYFYSLAYMQYVSLNYYKSLSNLIMAYNENSENLNTKQLVQEVFARYLFTETNFTGTLDSIEYYFAVFPFLAENPLNQRYYTYCYMWSISNAYNSEDAKKGEEYLARFNDAMNENELALHEQGIIGAYYDVSSYYLSRRKYDTAEKYIKEGLKWLPNSFELKRQLELLKLHKAGGNFGQQNQNSSIYISEDNTIVAYEKPKDNFKEEFKNKFIKNWKAISVTDDSETKKILPGQEFEIEVRQGMKVDFMYENNKIKGTWALRDKSRLLYLIPEQKKDEYILFRVVSISDTELKLRPFKDRKKLSSTVITLKAK